MPNDTQLPDFYSDLDLYRESSRISGFGDIAEIELDTEQKKAERRFSDDLNEFQLDESTIAGGSATPANVTQRFGNRNSIEKFSGGVNYGVDFGLPKGSKVALPDGQWEVVDAFSAAKRDGRIGDSTNKGYGNSVLVRNTKTGELLRLSHLSRVAVKKGQKLSGGNVVGLSGATGNVTGPHLDVEYYDKSGKIADVLKTPYASTYTGGQGGGGVKNVLGTIGDFVKKGFKEFNEQQAAKTDKEKIDELMPLVMGAVTPVKAGVTDDMLRFIDPGEFQKAKQIPKVFGISSTSAKRIRLPKYLREGLQRPQVEAYKEAIRNGVKLDPLVVDPAYNLIDGTHRLTAIRELGLDESQVALLIQKFK